MIIVQDKIVSDDVVEEQFVCNLQACKGACCWEGDFGAPLEPGELPVMQAILEEVKPFLSPAGLAAIEKTGAYQWFEEADDYGTTLIDGGPCAYMTFDSGGVAQCGIEQAWRAGATAFRKPVSCHLYPIRVVKNEQANFEALNYDRWDICSAACENGKKLKVPVYQFLKEAIIRQYGEAFYEELDGAAQFMKSQNAAE